MAAEKPGVESARDKIVAKELTKRKQKHKNVEKFNVEQIDESLIPVTDVRTARRSLVCIFFNY